MAVKLTERTIERMTCPEGARDRLVFDAEQRGLAVRVLASGAKSYLAQYSAAGRKRRVPLGGFGAISLAQARDAARAVMGKVALGADVAADRKEHRERVKVEALRERLTLGRLVADWTRLHLSGRRPSYQREAPRAIERAFADWWARPAEKLDRAAVVRVLDALAPAMRRAVGAYGRACFGWAVKRGTVPGNPFVGVPLANVEARDRVLTDAEAARVWDAAGAASPASFGAIVRLLLLTGQRREEVAGMAWAELSPDLSTWTIPAERTKNGAPTIVPLPAAARALLPAEGGAGLVFPGEHGRAFNGWSKSKAALDKASGVVGWRLHDLRRTCATGLQRLGVRLEVTEAVLNHVSGSRAGIVGVYQRHAWTDEKRDALDRWAAHVLAAVSGEPAEGARVVRLRRA